MIATVSVGALALTVDKWRTQYLAEKDATLRHYIELHPEDFPTPGKPKTHFSVLFSLPLLIDLKQQEPSTTIGTKV